MNRLLLISVLSVSLQLVFGQSGSKVPSVLKNVAEDCSIDTTTIADYPPVFIRGTDLWAPEKNLFKFKAGDSAVVSCNRQLLKSGKLDAKKVDVLGDKKLAKLTCVSGKDFKIDGISVEPKDFNCAIDPKAVTGTALATIISNYNDCFNGVGKLRYIGFDVDGRFVAPYIQVCYNEQTSSAIYSRHTIYGKATKVKGEGKPGWFDAATTKWNIIDFYAIQKQEDRLTVLLKDRSLVKANYVNNSMQLTRGHLAPDGDGIFRTWRWASYYYINTAPQWKSVNSGSWNEVENIVRKEAVDKEQNLLIFTGVYGVMTLPDKDKQQVPITLHAEGIEVPKLFWKIVKSVDSKTGIAFVTHNDPFNANVQKFCNDICSQKQWYPAIFAKYQNGFTYCCTVNDLMAKIPGIPKEAAVEGVIEIGKPPISNQMQKKSKN